MSRDSRKRFDRRALLLGAPPVELWPSVDTSHLQWNERNKTNALYQALWDLFSDSPTTVASILRQYGVHRETLYRAARKCLAKHPDGQIWGFRAALKYVRTKVYERQTAVQPVAYERTGCAGAFSQLMRDYPAIEQTIRKAVRGRCQPVKPGQQVRQPIRDIHREFIKACRDAGITADRYPLNTRRQALRSLSTFISSLVNEDFDMAASHAGSISPRAAPGAVEQAPAATHPFDVVEFDGHRIDLRLTIKMIDPFGMEQTLELQRVWILVILDVYTRAVLGYHIALGQEYNKDDVAATIQAALTPALPRHYRIPELIVKEGGGFPSAIVPQTAFACWDWFRMDGAKSHLAGDTLIRLNQIVGCWTDNGPPATPNDRPYIERFFHLIARHFAHRLPGTVGSSPDSIERALSDPKGDLRLFVELPELEDMVHVLQSNYNATAHSGVGGKTPLEAMAYSVRSPDWEVRTVPMPLRSNLCLMQEARIVQIKGSAASGTRPHINFCHVRYTSTILAGNSGLIGRKVRIYYDVRDIRAVKAFFEDGTELGVLTAARPWNLTPHSLRLRQEIHRLIAERKLILTHDECPVVAWTRYRWRQVKTSKRAVNALAKAQLSMVPHIELPPPTSVDLSTACRVADVLPTTPEIPPASQCETVITSETVPADPPKPKVLKIRRTITF